MSRGPRTRSPRRSLAADRHCSRRSRRRREPHRRPRAGDVVRRVADHEDIGRRQSSGRPHARARSSAKGTSALRSAASSPNAPQREVAPQIEVLELDPRAFLEVAGQQPEEHVVARGQRVEQVADAGHDGLRRRVPGSLDLLREVGDVAIAQRSRATRRRAASDPARPHRQDRPVGAAGDRDAVEPIGMAEELFAARGSSRGGRRRRSARACHRYRTERVYACA